jgi:hypothetical protein
MTKFQVAAYFQQLIKKTFSSFYLKFTGFDLTMAIPHCKTRLIEFSALETGMGRHRTQNYKKIKVLGFHPKDPILVFRSHDKCKIQQPLTVLRPSGDRTV